MMAETEKRISPAEDTQLSLDPDAAEAPAIGYLGSINANGDIIALAKAEIEAGVPDVQTAQAAADAKVGWTDDPGHDASRS